MSLLPHLLGVKPGLHAPRPIRRSTGDSLACPGHSCNFACLCIDSNRVAYRRDVSRNAGRTAILCPSPFCKTPASTNTSWKQRPSKPWTGKLLCMRNFTHPFLPCLVFPFCSHYLFIWTTQDSPASQTSRALEPYFGKGPFSLPTRPQQAPVHQQCLWLADKPKRVQRVRLPSEWEREEGENSADLWQRVSH